MSLDYRLRIFDRGREVLTFELGSSDDAESLGRILTLGNGRLFSVESPLPGVFTCSALRKGVSDGASEVRDVPVLCSAAGGSSPWVLS